MSLRGVTFPRKPCDEGPVKWPETPVTYADMSVVCDLGVMNFNPTSRTAVAQALDDLEIRRDTGERERPRESPQDSSPDPTLQPTDRQCSTSSFARSASCPPSLDLYPPKATVT
ncbi:unnamed protein product [Leuciscus chuanchicus]